MSAERGIPTARAFSAGEHALMAGWLDEVAFFGFGGALGVCDDGTEWLGVTLPGSRHGDDWTVRPDGGGFVIERVGDCVAAVFPAPDLEAALRFVAPPPPGCPEPRPLPGVRLPTVTDNDGDDIGDDWPTDF